MTSTQFPGALEAIPSPAAVVDERGAATQANPALAALLPRVDAMTPLTDLVNGADYALLIARLSSATADGPVEVTLLGDPPFPVEITLGPLIEGARVALFRDLRAHRAEQKVLDERHRDLTRLSDTVLEQAIELKHYSENLEARVRERTEELRTANLDAIYMLAVASEAKDLDTGEHVRRIERYTWLVAQRLGLPPKLVEEFAYSSVLHDIGKMAIPDEILKKPGELTETERQRIESHTVEGERMLAEKPFFTQARFIARSHHENWDGSGYPDGLSGEEIPLAARIVHLVDVFDALTSPRVYKKAWDPRQASSAIADKAGTSFDPDVVRVFLSLFDEGAFGALITDATAHA
ncbi:MAG: HD domain-containing protein [Phycisphaerales bacterium]|nr:HD domain-containing protein [Phycisphaerales bacterium]